MKRTAAQTTFPLSTSYGPVHFQLVELFLDGKATGKVEVYSFCENNPNDIPLFEGYLGEISSYRGLDWATEGFYRAWFNNVLNR